MNEMKVAVAKVIQKFKLRADEDNPPSRIMTLSMKSTTGVRIFVQPRDTTDTTEPTSMWNREPELKDRDEILIQIIIV